MQIFIISWAGQHPNAIHIANQIDKFWNEISIVYSDPDPDFTFPSKFKVLKRPNHLYWEDKFKSCLDNCTDDSMLIIHADCTCDNWENLIEKCLEANSSSLNIGVWAPQIKGSQYNLKTTGMGVINNTNLQLSCLTDGIVFSLSNTVMHRMRKIDYGENIYGWGLDRLFCVTAHLMGNLVVIDTSVLVNHSNIRGYDSQAAIEGMGKLLSKLNHNEIITFKLIDAYIRLNRLKNQSIAKLATTK